jgi:hypothetical protein
MMHRFERAWKILGRMRGNDPQRLYVMLQSMTGTSEQRIAALSALTGLLSAPVFETIAELAIAAEELERHDIGIPLLLKEPLIKAIEAQDDVGNELRVMNFFAGRYSRQARILLDPEFAKEQRSRLINRQAQLNQDLTQLEHQLQLVDFRTAEYVMATLALEAIKLDCGRKHAEYDTDLKCAQSMLLKLTPLIRDDALACLSARKNYLKKGGQERQSELQDQCDALRKQTVAAAEELHVAEKRASPESVNAFQDAKRYVTEGAEQALESAQKLRDKANADKEAASLQVKCQ